MKEFHGITASPGIAVGKAYHFIEENISVPKYDISPGEVENELKRFLKAIENATEEIEILKSRMKDSMGEDEQKVLESHIMMINDPELKNQVDNKLRSSRKNVEWILLQVIEEIVEKLKKSQDDYLKERSLDMQDVSRRILNQLLYHKRQTLSDLVEPVIIVAHNLMPSDLISLKRDMVIAIATDAGGKTSHTAILARSLEIPAVLGLMDISRYVKTNMELIVDGNKGVVILEPDKKTKAVYITSQEKWKKHELELLQLNKLEAETRDGKLINLEANIEIPEEVDSALNHGADGVGLFRSEFLFLQPNRYPTEEEQYKAYKFVLERMKNRPVTIRTLDLGGDKTIYGLNDIEEKNPILGWRAIRFCLSRPDIFKVQLRALLRASVHGNLRVMFPMISGIEEVDHSIDLFQETKRELEIEGIPFNGDVPIGIMIEIPSAALTSDILAKKVDFFSIGTNDLIQYTIAVDRGNERITYLYEPFHPGVLKLIQMTIENGHRQGIPVGMCGEMASDPLATTILLGMGLDEFSMSPISIPEVKRIIRSVTLLEAEEVVGTVLEMDSYADITEYIREWMDKRFEFETISD